MMKNDPVIGVIDLSMSGWAAGAVVTKTMLLSLKAAGAKVVFLTTNPQSVPSGIKTLSPPTPTYLPGEWTLRKLMGKGAKDTLAACARSAGIDVLLPAVGAMQLPGISSIGWIPDFQHVHLPTLCSDEQARIFDREYGELAKRSDRMLFSSEDSRGDFIRGYPAFASKGQVASFPSLFAFEPPDVASEETLKKYQLPKKFLLVINQFWRHKNHRVVAEAISLLKERGILIPVVMVGVPADYRDKQNEALSETLQAASAGGVWSQCIVLGKVKREELLALLQSASAIIQPSLFEGWNTTVQDAKALGCPVILSDLPVHREQCPDAFGFFPPLIAASLADVIADCWQKLPPRPDREREMDALSKERKYAEAYGRRLVEICSEAL